MNPKRLWGLAIGAGIGLVLLDVFSSIRLTYRVPCYYDLPCTAYRDTTRDTYFVLAQNRNPVHCPEAFIIRQSSVILTTPKTTVFPLGFIALADDKGPQVLADGTREKGNHFNAHLSVTANDFSFKTKSGGRVTVNRL